MATHHSDTDARTTELALAVVRHGRELGAALARLSDAPIGDLSRSTLSATLRRLETGEVTDTRDHVVFEALQTGLTERLAREVTGSTLGCRFAGYDAEGEIWSWEAVPTYSERGETAYTMQAQLARFLDLRQELLDHLNAQRLAARLR